MDISDNVGAKQHEIQHLLIALDPMGKDFGTIETHIILWKDI